MLHLLNEKKSEIQKKMQSLWDVKEKEKKTWTREQTTEYDQLASDLKKVSDDISRKIEYQRYINNDKTSLDEQKFNKQTENVDVGTLVRSMIYKRTGDHYFKEDTGKVQEFCREHSSKYGETSKAPDSLPLVPQAFKRTIQTFQRALDTSTSSGGHAIQDHVETPTLDVLYANTVLAKAGAKVKELPAGMGSYAVVKLVDSSTNRSSMKALANTELDTRSVSIEQAYELTPKRLGRIIEIQNLWLRQSKDPGVIERALLKEWASAFDAQALDGDGTSPNIKGILRDTSILTINVPSGTTANEGRAISWDLITEIVETIESKNASAEPISFIINPKVKRRASNILKSATSGAKFVFENDMLGGKQTAITTLMSSSKTRGTNSSLSEILAITPSRVCLPHWGLPTISLSDTGTDWFKKDQTAMRVQGYANAALEYPDSMHCKVLSVKTTA